MAVRHKKVTGVGLGHVLNHNDSLRVANSCVGYHRTPHCERGLAYDIDKGGLKLCTSYRWGIDCRKAQMKSRSGAILLVEDDEDIRDAVVGLLEDEGMAVLTATNGQEALDLLQSGQKIRLILLDLMMPV